MEEKYSSAILFHLFPLDSQIMIGIAHPFLLHSGGRHHASNFSEVYRPHAIKDRK